MRYIPGRDTGTVQVQIQKQSWNIPNDHKSQVMVTSHGHKSLVIVTSHKSWSQFILNILVTGIDTDTGTGTGTGTGTLVMRYIPGIDAGTVQVQIQK